MAQSNVEVEGPPVAPDRRRWSALDLWQSDRRLAGPLRADHVRFGLIGLYNTAFSYAVFASVTLLFPGVYYLVALLISHVLGVLNAYVAYRLLVFRVRGRWLGDLFRFWLVYLGQLGVNLVALPLLVEIVGLHVLVAQGLVVIAAVAVSWFGHKHFSFARAAEVPNGRPARDD